MGKPHPMALRERVVAFVEEGHSNREASRHFRVSPRFVNDLMILHRETGSLVAKQQGRPRGSGKLADEHEWVRQRMARNGDLTLDELRIELAERGVSAHRSSLGRLLHRLGLSHKKKAWPPANNTGLISPGPAICGSTGGCRSFVSTPIDWYLSMRHRPIQS